MSGLEIQAARLWDDPEYFRTAVVFTARETLFAPRLIEKDYLCTVLLEYLSQSDRNLVFKGGTCLAKVHSRFCRLSEDLDFALPTAVDSTRGERSRRTKTLKQAVATLPRRLPIFSVPNPITGARGSTQYIASVKYKSLLAAREESIKIEVGLREPILLPAENAPARTILKDPGSGGPLVPPIEVRCISSTEAFAEKLRAALSRREPAVRDFFDIDFAVRKLGLDVRSGELVSLVRRKLLVPGNEPADVSEPRLAVLVRQVDSQLRPVLREADFTEFDLERAVGLVKSIAAALSASAR
ncbi:MAG: nucleotidyl transferase AbiEii/AbiGii toxin family protein [Deltaproteobacteria bacterium]|nr:nucleotidyl transferase AbiEii/AbiGii toxin family protein [Deltaproteobacteria bacterium]